ncbi:Peptidase M3A/M3B [Metarhizium guizhouense ARSEF 977]|uniref:Peptidase M3A/M3B n=1 Tax=Metarhizium guizhouense (strain ARSEF 977) TaxID=1276136 RepID=A0A0B4I231_METGA|nr:Peptidase M3A/M3B [Metarhizium guizhouense ARSEF 977]
MTFGNVLPPPKFDLTPEEMFAKAAYILELAKDGIYEITSSVEPEEATFENVIIPIGHVENQLSYEIEPLSILESVSPSAEIRKAASKAVKTAQEAWELIYDNEELFLLIDAVKHQRPAGLDEESRRFLADLHSECVEKGLNLPEAEMERYSEIRHRKYELHSEFVANLATDPGVVWKSDAELEGLSKSKLESFPADEQGRRRIPLHRTNADAIMRQCTNEQTRRDVWAAKESVYPENAAYFRETVLLRDEAARLLGFSSYNHQLVRRRMMKSPEAVMNLLRAMETKLKPLVKMEMNALRELRGDGGPIHFWDFAYYDSQTLKGRNVNSDVVAEYFPADFVLGRMLGMFEKLFQLEISEVADIKDDEVWHPDVKVYKVSELGGVFVGYLYMDLYPREGKYNSSADFNIRPSYIDREGRYVPSATALICNVTPPTKDTPALLHHSDVITIFHELGHGMHDLMGRTRYAKYHGWRGRRDFCEAPSQLLEFFCWLPQTLKLMSCHYSYLSEEYKQQWERMNPAAAKQPEKQIPEEMLSALIAAKNVNSAIWTARQVGLSIFDMKVHNPSSHEELEGLDIAKEYYTSITEATGLQGPEDEATLGNGYSTTAHFMWGQEANYYSYISTRILAADMWNTCFRDDPMNPETGLRYRQMVLDKGGSVDEANMVAAFLGREPNSDAYLEEIGVEDVAK